MLVGSIRNGDHGSQIPGAEMCEGDGSVLIGSQICYTIMLLEFISRIKIELLDTIIQCLKIIIIFYLNMGF